MRRTLKNIKRRKNNSLISFFVVHHYLMNSHQYSQCISVTKKLMQNKNAFPFLHPVDPISQSCPTYYDVIKNPMDLSTIMVGSFSLCTFT